METDCCEIAIVGGGCSGVLVAAQLLRKGFPGRIRIIEPRPQLGRGLAYSTPFIQHLLNVPAEKMSAFPDRPGHFLDWLRRRIPNCPERGFFAPRTIYGEYLGDVLRTALENGGGQKFSHISAEITHISRTDDHVLLTAGDGTRIRAERVVLAIGNPVSSPFPGISIPDMGGKWQASPWLDNALVVRFPGERVLLIGSGLTAIDSALALHNQEHPAQTYLISRRGILPQPHVESCSGRKLPGLEPSGNVRHLLRQVRERITELESKGVCWRVVLDALRPVSNQIWGELTTVDRSRFLRHLKAYWEPHRHRMAPEVHRQVGRFLNEGRMHLFAGRISGVSAQGEVLEAHIRMRLGDERVLRVDRIINCTGIQERYKGGPSRPLIRTLIQNHVAEANELGIGFRTDDNGALVTAAWASPRLFTLGPPRRGDLFETTAVPDIRVQAETLAQHLIELAASPSRAGNTASA